MLPLINTYIESLSTNCRSNKKVKFLHKSLADTIVSTGVGLKYKLEYKLKKADTPVTFATDIAIFKNEDLVAVINCKFPSTSMAKNNANSQMRLIAEARRIRYLYSKNCKVIMFNIVPKNPAKYNCKNEITGYDREKTVEEIKKEDGERIIESNGDISSIHTIIVDLKYEKDKNITLNRVVDDSDFASFEKIIQEL